MFAIIGMLVVLAAVIGGFLMEHGPLRVLMQPSELLIIAGAAAGTLLVANPLHTLKGIVSGVMLVISGSKFTKKRYLDALKMMYDLFGKIRHEGLAAVENDVEAPMESKFFAKYPDFLKDHDTRDFVCDTMRMAIMGGVEPFDVDQMIESDMDVHDHEVSQPMAALSTMADSLPGLGIVAAVLGVVMTMSALGGPPEEIGKKVAAALVGTFLGILLCYGFVGPLAANMAKLARRGARVLARAAGGDDRLHEGHGAAAGGGDGTARRFPATCVPPSRSSRPLQGISRDRRLPQQVPSGVGVGRTGRGFVSRPNRMATTNPVIVIKRRAVTAATTAEPGRWPMPILSPP